MVTIRDQDLLMLAALRYEVQVGNKARRLRYMVRDKIKNEIVGKFISIDDASKHCLDLTRQFTTEVIENGRQ